MAALSPTFDGSLPSKVVSFLSLVVPTVDAFSLEHGSLGKAFGGSDPSLARGSDTSALSPVDLWDISALLSFRFSDTHTWQAAMFRVILQNSAALSDPRYSTGNVDS